MLTGRPSDTQVPTPQISYGSSVWKGYQMGQGIVRYTININATGSAQNVRFAIPKQHRLLQLRAHQVVTSTGVSDATGLNLEFEARDTIQQSGSSGTDDFSLASSGGSLAQDTINFDFGNESYVGDYNQEYNIAWTGQNNDNVSFDLYIQYIE